MKPFCLFLLVCIFSFILSVDIDKNEAKANPSIDYPYVIAKDDCAPWDGKQLDLSFYSSEVSCEDESQPLFKIAIWKSPIKAGDEIVLDRQSPTTHYADSSKYTGYASKIESSDTWQDSAASAKIKITDYSTESIKGDINIQFKDKVEKGSFVAKVCEHAAICG